MKESTALYSFDYYMSSIFLEFRMIETLCNLYLILFGRNVLV